MTLAVPNRYALSFAFLLMCTCVDAGACRAETYVFDRKNAEVRFTYYVGPISQSGRFTELAGLFEFDERAPERASINATVKTASLKASQWENELKGSNFFNVAVWPEIRFKSRAVRPTAANSSELTGDLTMNGVTQPVTLKMAFDAVATPALSPNGQQTSEKSVPHLIATTRIRRSSFNMTALGFLVDDEIDIEINTALQKKQ
jgi:polyisoprenoid-binding protein YceI